MEEFQLVKNKVLLTILPYWSPIIPPAGLSYLKSYLEPKGYRVRLIDLNVKNESLKFYYDYFDILKECIPEKKKGTFFNIGHEVMRSHLMVHLYCTDDLQYIELVKMIIFKWFYVDIESSYVEKFKNTINEYLKLLDKYILYLIDFEQPEVIGATIYKTNIPLTIYFMKQVKKLCPQIKTVIGGGAFADSHSVGSSNFKTLLEITDSIIDKIIIGAGEELLYKYLSGELNDKERVYSTKDIKKTIYSEEKSMVLDFSDFNMRKYSHLVGTSSISCPFTCSFCNEKEFWGPYRKRNIKHVVDEMVELYNKHRRQLFFMTDSLLNPTVNDLSEEMSNRGVNLYYDAYFRIDNPSSNIQNTMKWRKGGLYRVRIGIESGSQKMLDLMNKKITVNQIKSAIINLALAGIKTTTYWLIGHPGETEEDFQMTLNLIKELKNYIWQAECNIFQYFYEAGQNNEDAWSEKSFLLYPEETFKFFKFKEWQLDSEPSREVIFERMHRFINYCKELGIPNPYSAYETYTSEIRWKNLHKNAVPPIEEITVEGKYYNETINQIQLSNSSIIEEGEFDF